MSPRVEQIAATRGTITVSAKTVTMLVGQRQQLSIVGPATQIVWQSDNPAVATVSSEGLISAETPGKARVIARAQSAADTSIVTVVPEVDSIRLAVDSVEIAIGQTARLGLIIFSKAGTGDGTIRARAQWTSSSPSTATVDSTGLVSTLSLGRTAIAVSVEGMTDTAIIKATSVAVAAVNLSAVAPFEIASGEQHRLDAVVVDAAGNLLANRVIAWSSSDSAIARVSQLGVVVAVGRGSANITASSEGKSASVAVTSTSSAEPSAAAGEPAAAQLLVTTVASTPSLGRTLRVAAGGNLQRALDSAVAGDRILLAAGAIFTGNFVLPVKTSGGIAGGWITVQSDGSLPAEGSRMTASAAAGLNLPKLRSATVLPVLTTAAGTARWRFIGLEVTTDPALTSSNALVELGTGAATSVAQLPKNLILDRMYIHGTATLDLHRCIALNGDSTAVIDSYVADCHANGLDAQAAWGWNGNGPYKIVNNYLEASSEVLGFGGADPQIPNLVPSDVEIRGNHITRPMTWKGGPWLIKNLIEFKNARRVLIDGNVLENSWPHGQLGWAFVMWSVNQQGGCTWCVTSDVLVRNNVIRNVSAGFQLNEKYGVAVPMQRIAIRNNVMIGIDNPTVIGGGYGFLVQGVVASLSIEHNTFFIPTLSAFEWVSSTPSPNHIVRNNLSGGGNYPLFASPTNTWASIAGTGSEFSGNVVALAAAFAAGYPAGNWYPTSLDALGLAGGGTAAYSVNASPSALALASTSAYKGKATDGTDPGANISAITNATGSAVVLANRRAPARLP